MPTTVINLRNATAVREAQERGTFVRIDRRTKWGNPFRIGRDGDRAQVIADHAAWIRTQPQLLASLHELRGKTLACWCHPLPCHGHTLAQLADEGIPTSTGQERRP